MPKETQKMVWPTIALLKKKFFRLVYHPIFPVITVFGNLLILSSATAMYFVEKDINPKINSMLDTIWWAVATVTTVGYGDVSPMTVPGKIIGLILMVLGTALFWSYTALFANALITDEIEEFETEMMTRKNKF